MAWSKNLALQGLVGSGRFNYPICCALNQDNFWPGNKRLLISGVVDKIEVPKVTLSL